MKAPDLFGPVLLPTHEFVGWLSEDRYKNCSILEAEGVTNLRYKFSYLVAHAHQFLSRPIDISYLARPSEE